MILEKGGAREETDAGTPHFLIKRNKAKRIKSKSTRDMGGRRVADPRKQELPARRRKSAQTRRLEGNPEGGAQRGIRGVWGKDVRRSGGTVVNGKQGKKKVGLNKVGLWTNVTQPEGTEGSKEKNQTSSLGGG